jgi:Flp pilus assembly protein TadD
VLYSDSVLVYDAHSADAIHLKGMIFIRREDFDSARRALTRAAEIQPLNASIMYGLGLSLYGSGDSYGAVMQLKRAVSIEKGEPRYWNGLAATYLAVGNADESISAYRKSLELDSLEPSTYFGLAEVQATLGQRSSAIGNYRKFIRMSSDSLRISEARRRLRELGATDW